MSGFDFSPDRRRPAWLPTAAAVAAGVLLTAAPPAADRAVRSAVLTLAGPALACLPAPAADPDPAAAPVAELAREIARLRAELSAGQSDGAADPLVRPAWLTVRALGAAANRGGVAELLVAAVGTEAAAADAAGLSGALPAIDAGADRQVRAGDLVVRGGAVVGRVDVAGRWTATVRPITDENFRLVVTLPADGGETTGVLAGAGPGSCVLRHVPPTAGVRVGAVVTCEAAETGGAAVPVGVVERVMPRAGTEPAALFVRPLATLTPDAAGAVRVVRSGLNRRRVASARGGAE